MQDQIENIPVPKDSPHYSHYRQAVCFGGVLDEMRCHEILERKWHWYPVDDLLDVRQNSASISRLDESRRWMVTPFSYVFPFDVKALRNCTIDCLP